MENEKDIFDHLILRKIDVPDDGYFDQLSSSVIEQSRSRKITLIRRPLFWSGLAAASVILVFSIRIFWNAENTAPLALTEPTTEEIMHYIDNNLGDFEEELIANSIPFDELVQEAHEEQCIDTPAVVMQVPAIEELTKEEILEYLDQYNLDQYSLEENVFI